ncbi:hypothetical protein [Pinirhizobacter sp.]|jgi:hypothetical protein|uniref:hypothetical protein n=1 Tax=Pinirhizobacter sp. TaxID=2950432 RepID=UPI002F407A80
MLSRLRFPRPLGLALACAAMMAGCATQGTPKLAVRPQHPQDLGGHWVVDPSRSEDPDAKIALLASERRGQGGGMGGHGGGHGGGGGGMGGMGGGHGGHGGGGHAGNSDSGSPSSAGQGAGSGLVESLQRRGLIPDKLDIVQKPGLVLLSPDGHPRSVSVDIASSTSPVGTQAGWDGDTFVVVMHTAGRPDVTQRYSVTSDRKWLTVTTDMKMGKSSELSFIREFSATTPP